VSLLTTQLSWLWKIFNGATAEDVSICVLKTIGIAKNWLFRVERYPSFMRVAMQVVA